MTLTENNTVTLNQDGTLAFKDGITKDEWFEAHRKLLHAKRYAAAWLKASQAYAIAAWGMEFAADAVAQIELDLGIEVGDQPVNLNPLDKSRSFLSIDGISARFMLWERKMHDEIETWDAIKLKRALDLLEPMERQAKRVRELLGA